MKKQEAKKVANPLFEKKFQNFSTGQGIQPKRDFTDFITWSHYTQLQWQRAILYEWLEVLLWLTSLPRPWTTKELLSCLSWPGSTDQRKQRLLAWVVKKTTWQRECPHWDHCFTTVLWMWVNTATILVESKKSILVMTVHVMHPLKLVAFLPALCHKMGFPTVFSRGRPIWSIWSIELLNHTGHLDTG